MNVAILGTGYVGLVSGVCLAAKGHDVKCVDHNLDIINNLMVGKASIYEPGLPEMLQEVIDSGMFSATSDLNKALNKTDIVIIAVGTPSIDGEINLKYILTAVRQIAEFIKHETRHISIVIKSTVIPGTTDTIIKKTLENISGKKSSEFGLGMNPEFLREGKAISDFMNPDRIILGYEDVKTLTRLKELYSPWPVDKLEVNTRTAELTKYANNTILATQISAVNEIANLAAVIGDIDIMDVLQGVHLDKRWNPYSDDNSKRVWPDIISYLKPGCGFGGSCFPKDIQALRSQGIALGLKMSLLNGVLEVNQEQPKQVGAILKKQIGDLKNTRVLVLGLAFKPETDDVRESASIVIIDDLLRRGCEVLAHDPIACDNFRSIINEQASDIEFVEKWQEFISQSEVIIISTKWLDYQSLRSLKLKGKIIFDARRMFSPKDFPESIYLSIGYKTK